MHVYTFLKKAKLLWAIYQKNKTCSLSQNENKNKEKGECSSGIMNNLQTRGTQYATKQVTEVY